MWKLLITVCIVMHLANSASVGETPVPSSQCNKSDKKFINQPIVCKLNAKYVGCVNPCALSCANRHKKVLCQTIGHIGGCACNAGFLLDGAGNCIKEEKCPAVSKPVEVLEQPIVCKWNAHKVDYVSPCNPSCANWHKKTSSCLAIHGVRGCICDKGLFMNDEGKCIPQYHCPAPIKTVCGPNEVLNKCGNGCGIANEAICNVTPPFNNPTIGKICPKVCKSICECEKGFARNMDYKCVPIKKC